LAKASQIFENNSVLYKPIRRRYTLKMDPMITTGIRITSPMFLIGRGQRPRIGAVPRDLALQP